MLRRNLKIENWVFSSTFVLVFQLKQFKEEKRREEKALGVEEESEEIRKIKKVKTRV